jgi:RimJ/RimL family protein N-acetyltransferase
MEIPVLETERLILRAHTLADFPAYLTMWQNPQGTRFLGGPQGEEDAWARFLRGFGQWHLLGYGYWSVHDKASGERLGETGFFEARRTIEPSLIGIPEAGWSFATQAHGKGYASEAVEATHRWADARFAWKRMTCIIAPENAPSLRVAAKCGYREAAKTTYKNEPILVFYRDR